MKQVQFAVVAFASVLFACGGDPRSGQAQALEAPVPIGTFESSAGEISRLVLMANGTVHLELASSAVIDSFYKRTDFAEGGRLDFVDGEGAVLDAYEYRYDGATLEVLREGASEWQSLSPAPAWCGVPEQCTEQLSPHLMCPGQWSCISNGCQFQCSSP
jgi:hypothetical protein